MTPRVLLTIITLALLTACSSEAVSTSTDQTAAQPPATSEQPPLTQAQREGQFWAAFLTRSAGLVGKVSEGPAQAKLTAKQPWTLRLRRAVEGRQKTNLNRYRFS
jgi:uncharacterized lipoprotein YmbA